MQVPEQRQAGSPCVVFVAFPQKKKNTAARTPRAQDDIRPKTMIDPGKAGSHPTPLNTETVKDEPANVDTVNTKTVKPKASPKTTLPTRRRHAAHKQDKRWTDLERCSPL